MPGDDFRFTTELTALDTSKLDRTEKRAVEGLYRTKEYLDTELRERLLEVESERDLFRTRVDRLQAERDALRDRLDGLEAERGTVAPDRLVASLGDAFTSARDDLSEADYAIGRIEVDLKANVVGGGDGPQFQLPDLAESVDRETLSTLRFDLRPTTRDDAATYDPIPDVRDRSLDEAREAVRRAGFTVGEVTTEPGDADDVVIDQFPSPRSVAEPGTAVDLTVSERREIDVPAVIGNDLDDAVAALSAAGLSVGEVDAETRDEPADAVVGQTPAAGESVPAGTAVDLTVSVGPASDSDTDAGSADGRDEEGGGAGPDLQAVDGIGPTYADRLRAAGVTDLPTLLDRDPDEVAEITRASTNRVETWFDHAKRLLEGE
ncbi:PASTA domain-containing protein [Haloplanus halophilus]|uniref:PASTA domain-containing protein n=1 Tax=Haloplanus halophilus TaxID=2949993 RepID=UPI00203CBEB5|nr:PASTA domain-containing protein [Haloplanus sp. GDY1]